MPAAKNVNIHVEGNFSGNIIIGDNNVVQTPHGIQIDKTKIQTKFETRPKPINLRPRAFAGLLGRINELQTIQNALSTNLPVTLFGENGIGKTSILRQTAHDALTKQFTDGVIYLSANGDERDDLLQELFDAIYVGTPNRKPTEAQIRNDLKDIHALVILDDIALEREDTAILLDAMPKSVFILASDERALWGEGQAIGLHGLSENESLQLFERELGRILNQDEKPIAIQICKILLFHPLRILQAASLMREDSLSIQQTFTSLTATKTKSAPLEVTLQKSNETQKKILSLLAVAGGFALTREHLQKLAGSGNFELDIKPLMGRGLVEVQGANFSLSPESVSSLVRLWDLSGWEDVLINHFSNWLQTAPQDMLIDQVANTLFYLIQRAGEKKQWKNVTVIGKRLEQFYALQKKWAGWLKILNLIHMAARYLKDQYLEGWALHQLGSRAMCLDLKIEASELLNQALKIRKAIGDKGGLQVTQHNLNVLMNVPISNQVRSSRPKPKSNTFLRLLLFGGAGFTFILFAIFLIIFLPRPVAPIETEPPTSKPISTTKVVTPTRDNTLTPSPTRHPPTKTKTPTPTSTSLPCYLARYVGDLTYPDGSVINTNTSFTKSWRIRNAGSCTWDSNIQIIFQDGEYMSFATTWIDQTVRPGQTADISINGTSPLKPGTFKSDFILLAPDGTYFGLGEENDAFYLKIVVNAPPPPPQPLSPLDGDKFCSGVSIKLDWAESYDPDGIANYEIIFYEYQVSDWVQLIKQVVSASPTEFYTPSYPPGYYGWWVRAKDKHGAWSELSDFQSFETDICID